jgi:membrane protein implicated in regulation of membrane protease activity
MLSGIEIAYYHWVIICLGFWVLELLKLSRIAAALVVSAGVMVVITYLVPDLFWGWQLWGFIMMMALCSIIYLRRLPPVGETESSERELQEMAAADLVGTRVLLTQPLYPGTSKLEVGGRFWKVSANRDFPAGAVVEVVGKRGNTLEITSSDLPSYGRRSQSPENLPLDDYQHDVAIEEEYGKPDFDYWLTFQDALVDHRKVALVYAYHVLSGIKGLNLDEARMTLNTYTLALYDNNEEGQYMPRQKQMSSQPRIYSFLYMNGKWTGRGKNKFEAEMNELVAALHSDWAVKYRGHIDADKVLRAVMMIRSQQTAKT